MSPVERDLGCWLAAAQHESAVCPGSQEGERHPRVHQTQHTQLLNRDGYPTALSSGGPPLESCVPFWASQFRMMGNSLYVSRRGQKNREGMSCKEQLRTLEKRMLRGDLISP